MDIFFSSKFSILFVLQLSREDVAKHTAEKDCWIIIKDKVYNVTTFLDDHPGGPDIVLEHAGEFFFSLQPLRQFG
jgi:cytochrome b involved in lipid metabolism